MTSRPLAGADATLVLVATPGTVARLAAVLDALAADPLTGRMPLVLLAAAESEAAVSDALGDRPVRVVLLESVSRSPVVSAVVAELASLGTPAFAAVRLPRVKEVPALSAALGQALADVQPPPTGAGARPVPRLLDIEQTLPTLASAHAAARIAAGEDVAGDAIGDVLDLAAGARLETVDPVEGALRVGAWLDAGLPEDLPEPSWRFEVLLVDGDRVVAASQPVPLRRRVDRFGARRWDELVADVPLRDVPDGDHTLAIRAAAPAEGGSPGPVTRMGTRQGPLLSARTTLVDVPGAGPVRYLVHSARRGPGASVLVRRGDGPAAERAWDRRLRALDADFVLRYPGSRRMRLLRLARILTRPLVGRREIWLVGERPDTAQDNGMHLFRHLRTHEPDRAVYYVIDEDSPQAERVRDLGNVIGHSSLRHRLYVLHARVLADAYSIHHMLPRQWDAGQYARHLAWRVGALRVYLKHGVHLSPNAVKRGSAGYDVFLTATRRETEVIRQVTGYDAQVEQTGLPRYDALTPTPPSRTVLFMSTWRRYLVPKLFAVGDTGEDLFTGSTYEQFVRAFLGSDRLARMLERYDHRLEFLPHYNLARPVAALPTAGDRITIADPDAMPIQEQLRRCDLLVTDYSSVHFDVAYMGTPVIYSRFDEEDFETRHASASWFDYDTEGFGPVARTLEDTLDALEAALARGCTVEPQYAQRVTEAFGGRDTDNCARVVAAIDRRLASS